MATPRDFAKLFSKTEKRNIHDDTVGWIKDLGNSAANAQSPKHEIWNKVEQTNRVFVDAGLVDADGNARVNESTRFVIPWARSIRDTILTSIWLPWADRSPIIPMTGQSPDDVIKAQLTAHHADWQLGEQNGLIKIYAGQADAVDFGFSMFENRWVEDKRAIWTFGPNGERIPEYEDVYSGNTIRNVDPYRALKDPHVPAGLHQDGKFCGYSYNASGAEVERLAARRDSLDRGWINRDKIKSGSHALKQEPFLFGSRNASMRNRVQGLSDPDETITDGISFNSGAREKKVNFHILTIMEIWVVPSKDLLPSAERAGMSIEEGHFLNSEDQELWRFTLLDGEHLVDVEPQDQVHFSFHVSEPHPDLRSLYVPGVVEMMMDLQSHIDWIFRTHVASVETGLNGIRVIDDSALDINDFMEEGNGVLARLKPEAFGRDPRTAIYDVPYQDHTQQNLGDIQILSDIMQRQTGSTDGTMGLVSPGRRSATDVSNAAGNAQGRMRMLSQHITMTGLNPLFKSMIWNSQRRETQDRWVKITGTLQEMLQGENPMQGVESRDGFALVTPDQIQGRFDISVMDGRPAPESSAIGQNWLTLLQVASGIPGMTTGMQPGEPGRIDPLKIMRFFATSQGIKNFSEAEMAPSRITPEAMAAGDDGILEQAAAGNIAPVNPQQLVGR